MTKPHDAQDSPVEAVPQDGLVALAGSAVMGLVLAFGFVALMARAGGPVPAEAAVSAEAPVAVTSLYDEETGAHAAREQD